MLSQDSSDNENFKLLSQETFQHLCDQLEAEDCLLIDDPRLFSEQTDRPPGDEGITDVPQPVVSLPTLTEFAGEYGFKIEVGKPPKLSKSTSWCYSPDLNRLYVQLHKHCQLAFALTACGVQDARGVAEGGSSALDGSQQQQPSLFIRATPVFSNCLHLPVERCPNHVLEDAALDHCRHFVWADHPSVTYFSDASQRHTTVVPFQSQSCVWRKQDGGGNPASCCRTVWYDYSFKCRSTCTGSLNRRAVSIIFALESGDGTVLGRQIIEVKVCSCPGRDMMRDRKSGEGADPVSAPRPHGRAISNPSLANEPSKRHLRRLLPSSGGDSASAMQSRGTHNPSRKLGSRTPQVPARHTPLRFSAGVSHVQPSRASSVSPERTVKNDTPVFVQPSATDNDVYCIQVRTRKNYKILKAVSSLMSSGISPKAILASCMTGYLNAASTDSMHSDSDSKSGPISLTCSSQLSGCSAGLNGVQENAVGIEHISKVSDHSGKPSIQEWLDSLGLAPYTDDFTRAGFRTMADLHDGRRFSMKDLRKLRIGAAHSVIIWNSLKQWRLQV